MVGASWAGDGLSMFVDFCVDRFLFGADWAGDAWSSFVRVWGGGWILGGGCTFLGGGWAEPVCE